MICLFVRFFKSHEQFFSYLAIVTITGDRAALTAFSSEGSFTCHTYWNTGPPFLRSYPKDPWFSLLNVVILAKEQSLPILNVLDLTRLARAGLKLTTSRMLSESTTTRLRKMSDRIKRMIDYLFTVLRPAQEYFTYMETLPLPLKGCQNLGLC
jgi:hypothetical protein